MALAKITVPNKQPIKKRNVGSTKKVKKTNDNILLGNSENEEEYVAFTFRELLERYINDAPQVKQKLIDEEIIDEETGAIDYSKITYPTKDDVLDVYITYEQINYSENKLYFRTFVERTVDDQIVQYPQTFYFNGQNDQMPNLMSVSAKLPSGIDYTLQSLIAKQDVGISFTSSIIKIIIRDCAFNIKVGRVYYFNGPEIYENEDKYDIIKLDMSGDTKEIQIQTKELPPDEHSKQYNIAIELKLDNSEWESQYNYWNYVNPDYKEEDEEGKIVVVEAGLGGHMTLLKMSNNSINGKNVRTVPIGFGCPDPGGSSIEVTLDTLQFYGLNGSAYAEYVAVMNYTFTVNIISDGNVVIKDLGQAFEEDFPTRNDGDDYIIVTPASRSTYSTRPSDPFFMNFNIISQNINKYVTVKYQFCKANGYKKYMSLDKNKKLSWLRHYDGNMNWNQEKHIYDHPKPQNEMTSNFPLRYDMSGDDEGEWILPDDPMSEDPDNPEKIHFELNSIYFLSIY